MRFTQYPVVQALLLVLVFVCFVPARAFTEEPPSPLDEPARKLQAAFEAKDTSTIEALAQRPQVDPWLVLDHLCAWERFDVAEAYAKAVPGKDAEEMPAFVAASRTAPAAEAQRRQIRLAQKAYSKGNAAEVLAATDPKKLTGTTGVLRTLQFEMRAHVFNSLRKPVEASAAFKAAGDAARAIGWYRRAAGAYFEEAMSAVGASLFPQARAAFERTREIEALRGDRLRAAIMLGNIANIDSSLGDQPRAIAAFEQALALHRELGDRIGIARVQLNMGLAHDGTGEFGKARSYLEKALAGMEELGDKRGIAFCLSNLAGVYKAIGRYERSLTFYDRALRELKKLGDQASLAAVFTGMGGAYMALGKYAKALAYMERTRAAKLALGDEIGAARAQGNIAAVRLGLGEWEKALQILKQASAVLQKAGDRVGLAATFTNIGIAYRKMGDYEQAIKFQSEALDLQKAMGDRLGSSGTMGIIAKLHLRMGRVEEAVALYREALVIKETIGDKLGSARITIGLGRAMTAKKEYGEARKLLRKGNRLSRSLRAPDTRLLALSNLALLELREGKTARALSVSREALELMEQMYGGLGEEETASARQRYAQVVEIGALAALREGDAAEVVHFLESGRAGALLDMLAKRERMRWRAESLPEELRAADQAARDAQRRARFDYERARRRRNMPATRAAKKALDEAMMAMKEVSEQIQREMKADLEFFYPVARPIEDIMEGLAEDEVLILYGFCLEEAIAVVLTRDGEKLVTLGAAEKIQEACEALKLGDSRVDPSRTLATLKSLLIDPLDLPDGTKSVLVSPDGVLGYVPFGVLIEKTVTMAPSGTTHLLLMDRDRQPGTGRLGIGDPDYSGSAKGTQPVRWRGAPLSDLPSTRLEIEAVATRKLLGVDASEAGLRRALREEKRWQSVHFACHGLIDAENPGNSALALTRTGEDDGFLTAREVVRLEVPADVAVLSGCETTRGRVYKAEGIVGLSRAFMFAGAPRVICSLWKVDDEATSALMIKFYEFWQGDGPGAKGLPVAKALQQAQAHIRAQKKWSHPYYWAAWTLWGLPR